MGLLRGRTIGLGAACVACAPEPPPLPQEGLAAFFADQIRAESGQEGHPWRSDVLRQLPPSLQRRLAFQPDARLLRTCRLADRVVVGVIRDHELVPPETSASGLSSVVLLDVVRELHGPPTSGQLTVTLPGGSHVSAAGHPRVRTGAVIALGLWYQGRDLTVTDPVLTASVAVPPDLDVSSLPADAVLRPAYREVCAAHGGESIPSSLH